MTDNSDYRYNEREISMDEVGNKLRRKPIIIYEKNTKPRT
jgi:hypothetical protein